MRTPQREGDVASARKPLEKRGTPTKRKPNTPQVTLKPVVLQKTLGVILAKHNKINIEETINLRQRKVLTAAMVTWINDS